MGNFVSMSSVIGKTKDEVITSLRNYAISATGGLAQEYNIDSDDENCCIIEEENGNVSVFYPNGYIEWDNSSAFISKELNASVFSFHIHDSDLWMYVLYNKGQIVDQFNPVPDYWDENTPAEEIQRWKGNADVVTAFSKNTHKEAIEKYLVRWDMESETLEKAYPTDQFEQGEWQLIDFMSKLKLPYPIDNTGRPKGLTFKLWTNQLPLEKAITNQGDAIKVKKPWWRFW
jgi:hypothetical protein